MASAQAKKPQPKSDTAAGNEDGGKELTTQRGGALSAQDAAELAEFKKQNATGSGVSTDMADNVVPLLYILQPMSPQVDPNDGNFIKDAKPGQIWKRNMAVVDGENEGIVVQPVFFEKYTAEWVPRDSGGGLVTRHPQPEPKDVPGATKVVDAKDPKKISYMMGSNELIETRSYAFIVHGRDENGEDNGKREPFVAHFTGTNLTTARQLMSMMGSKRDENGKIDNNYFHLYRLKTKYRTNAKGKWYMWNAFDEGEVQSLRDLKAGKVVSEAFEKGEKKAEEPGDRGDGSDNAGEGGGDGNGAI